MHQSIARVRDAEVWREYGGETSVRGDTHDRTVRFVIGTVAAITGVWLGISTILGQMLVAVALLLFVTGAMRTKRVRKLLGGHGGRLGGMV